MVLSSNDDESQVISVRVQETIDSIKEIVQDHSDADIYAALKESGMDPNETAQKLLHQDPFHEVKRRRDRKKELTAPTKFLPAGRRNLADTSKHFEHEVSRTRYHTPWVRNVRRGGFVQKSVPVVSREFRVVRDNRVNQNTNHNDKQEAAQQLTHSNEQSLTRVPNNSSAGSPDQKHSNGSNSDNYIVSEALNRPSNRPVHAKDIKSSGSRKPHNDEHQPIASTSQTRSFPSNSALHSKLSSNKTVSGVYASISDPVHVPSPDSRPAGIVGAIRREVGVVGSRRQSFATISSAANSSHSTSLLEKDNSSQAARHQTVISKSNSLSNLAVHSPILPNSITSRSTQGGYNNSKLHQPSLGHQKVVHSNMEWKPKSGQKANIVSPGVNGSTSSPTGVSNSDRSNVVEVAGLSEKLSQINMLETQHVIIPQHLLVPESERTRLTFGSFGADFDSAEEIPTSNTEQVADESSVSTSKSIPAVSNADVFLADHDDNVDSHVRTSHSVSSMGTEESVGQRDERMDSVGPEDIESYADIGLIQSTSPAYGSTDVQQRHNNPSLSSFSAYENQTSYDVPFFRTVEDNIYNQGLTSSLEALGTIGSGAGPLSAMAVAPQQQFVQPQQPVAQMFPQVHIPHYVPYRHIFSPVYVPPMAMPNYSSNPAYPHPSNGNNYVLMPGGSSHLNAGGTKYSSQYKPVSAASPTGYGSYPNPPSFAINSGNVGNVTSFEDLNRVKYKDNSLYIPNAQAEAADMWIQTPRDVQNLQSHPYYNLPGQAPNAAFMPTHAGHAFNAAAQTSHLQYPGVYQSQTASVANPHHLVHQPVAPSLGGSVGVGIAAPGPQVGTYQQPQLGHLNWTPNF